MLDKHGIFFLLTLSLLPLYDGRQERRAEMPIKSSTFERIELSCKEAQRFIRHMQEESNPAAIASLARGRKALEKMAGGETFKFQRGRS
jgi:hypothetical protein